MARSMTLTHIPCGIEIPQNFFDGVVDMEHIRGFVTKAETLGYDSLWLQERILSDFAMLEPVTLLSYVAAITEKLTLGVSVILLTLRNPFQLAKSLATLDCMSHGRIIAGVGLGGGHLGSHEEILGYSREKRVRRFTEATEVMKLLWTEPKATFHGHFWDFQNVSMEPKPIQKPHPPLWFGGHHEHTFERVAKWGDGWMMLAYPAGAEATAAFDQLRRLTEQAGREPASLGIDVVSLANNHSGDYGEAGRESTMKALRAHGIAYGGLDRDGARAANLILPDGRKVAVTAFAPNNGTLNLNDIAAAKALIRRLKRTHDLVIVSFHGGAEGWDHVHVPHAEEYFYGEDRGNVEAFAHAAIDAGADLVIGQGPHVPRAAEIYRGRLIAYSLGNFWTYSGVNTYAVSGLGPVLEAWMAPDGTIAGFTVHSTRQAGLGVPRMDPLDEAGRYVLYLTRSDFPGTARRLERAAPLVAQGWSATRPGS